MELYLVRHAIAAKRRMVRRDRDRPLTEGGIRKMRRIARALCVLGIRADLILSSPLRRARETAGILAAELGSPDPEPTPFLEPGVTTERLCAFIIRRAGRARRVFLVGHEPALSILASVLLSGEAQTQLTMKKGGVCKLRVDRLRCGRCAVLEWLLTPRVLAKMR